MIASLRARLRCAISSFTSAVIRLLLTMPIIAGVLVAKVPTTTEVTIRSYRE